MILLQQSLMIIDVYIPYIFCEGKYISELRFILTLFPIIIKMNTEISRAELL